MFLHFIDVIMDAPAPPPPLGQIVHFFFLLIPLLVGLQIKHLHDAIIRVVAVISKELLDENLESFEACSGLKDVDGRAQDIDCDVDHGTSWEEAAGMVDKMALC